MIDFSKDKLLCMIVVDDILAEKLFGEKIPFVRGFILGNRLTGKLRAEFRFRYQDGRRNWYEMNCDESLDRQAALLRLRSILISTFEMVCKQFEIEAPITSHPVPADISESEQATMAWLVQQDLVEVSRVEMETVPGQK